MEPTDYLVILGGVAAVLTAIGGICAPFIVVFARRLDKKLNGIDAAVNQKEPHERHLRQIVVDTDAAVVKLREQLDGHTEQDDLNFKALSAQIATGGQTRSVEEAAHVKQAAANFGALTDQLRDK